MSLIREIIDANQYMTLGTADESSTPWASPVWFAHEDYREFLWVSAQGARHSRNLAVRPQLGIVIFDSHAPVGTGQGVYAAATASDVTGADIDRWIAIFSCRSVAQGAPRGRRRTCGRRPGCAYTARRPPSGTWAIEAACGRP
jgi:hypothetical protein